MRRPILLGSISLLFALPACRPPGDAALPGEEVGTYSVQASLTTNECGEGHPAPEALAFLVDLRHLGGTSRGYWQLPDGPQIDGTLEREASFRFQTTTQAVAIESNPALEIPGCAIERSEIVEGLLEEATLEGADAGVVADPEAYLAGTTRVRVTALPGGDCTPLLSIFGGPFPELPCRIEYELAGQRVGAAP